MKARRFGILLFFFLSLPAILGLRTVPNNRLPGVPPAPPGGFPAAGIAQDRKNRPESKRPGLPASATTATDRFGYSRTDAIPFTWFDAAAGGSEITFDDPDDSFSVAIPIGFNFKFYENSYSQLFVSTNGMILFGNGSQAFENEVIPLDAPPNDLIAAFWDDLVVEGVPGGGRVYKASGGSAPNRFVVVEWNQVIRRNHTDPLTFEVVLFENGDIEVRYQAVSGILDSSTVGIEDGDGIDGLLYLYNAPGISSAKTIRFFRPMPASRAKMLPTYYSGFMSDRRIEFPVQVRNTGDSPQFQSDVYDLFITNSDARWDVSLLNQYGSRLKDNDLDGAVDTGSVAQGASAVITVRLQAKESLAIGDHIEVGLTARSSNDLTKSASTTIQAAEPAPFAEAYGDFYQTGLYLSLTGGGRVVTSRVTGWISGSNMGIAPSPLGNFVYTWERRGSQGICADIEYSLVSKRGLILKSPAKLTDNCTTGPSVEDHLAVAAVAPNGFTGVVWIRDRYNQAWERNSNVFFALLSPEGTPIGQPVNITGNNNYFGVGVLNVPLYTSPFVIATGDNRFVVAAADQRVQVGGETSDIVYAVLNNAGATIKPATAFTHSTPGSIRYVAPTLAELVNNRAFLAFTTNNNNSTYAVAYAVLDSSGNSIFAATSIPGTNGWGIDAVQLSTGKILLAWIDPFDENSVYYLLNDASFTPAGGPVVLVTPDQRRSGNLSATRDREGHAVLTWVDSAWLQYLYYALVDDTGSVVTQPMRFYSGQGERPIVVSSYYGQGNAPLDPNYPIYMPVTIRR